MTSMTMGNLSSDSEINLRLQDVLNHYNNDNIRYELSIDQLESKDQALQKLDLRGKLTIAELRKSFTLQIEQFIFTDSKQDSERPNLQIRGQLESHSLELNNIQSIKDITLTQSSLISSLQDYFASIGSAFKLEPKNGFENKYFLNKKSYSNQSSVPLSHWTISEQTTESQDQLIQSGELQIFQLNKKIEFKLDLIFKKENPRFNSTQISAHEFIRGVLDYDKLVYEDLFSSLRSLTKWAKDTFPNNSSPLSPQIQQVESQPIPPPKS